MITTIIIFILILGLLIFVHEFGHFITAKKSGVRVEEFGFGFPPRIFGIKKGDTVYSINAIPLGGFVKTFGEDGGNRDNPESFGSKKPWQRAIILVAGIVMNFILAIVLLGFSNMIGLPSVVTDTNTDPKNIKIQISEVTDNSPAMTAGIKIGDQIKTVGELEVFRIGEFQEEVKNNLGKEVEITVMRGKEELTLSLTPRTNPPEGEGAIGVGLVETTIVKHPWYRAFWEGLKGVYYFTIMFITAIGGLIKNLILGGHISSDVAGPVGIAVLTNQVTKLGFVYVLNFTAILSLNLAIINGIPFPALDGGRLLFLAIEKIKGSPVSQKVEQMTHTIGFMLLLLLMVVITFRDIVRFF